MSSGSRVMVWFEDSLKLKLYDLKTIPRIGEKILIKQDFKKVVKITYTFFEC